MNSKMLFAAAVVAAMALPVAVQAQGVPGGFVHGAQEGWRIAGPVGAVVGAPVGAVVGGVEGVLGVGYNDRAPQAVPHRVHHRKARRARSAQ